MTDKFKSLEAYCVKQHDRSTNVFLHNHRSDRGVLKCFNHTLRINAPRPATIRASSWIL